MTHTRIWFRVMFLSVRGLAFIALLLVFFAPAVETKLFPVVSPMDSITHYAVDGGTIIAAGADKFRLNCDWRETKWFLGLRGNPDAVPMPRAEHRDAPQIRLGDRLHWDAIFVPLPWEVIATNTHANSRHICWVPPSWWPEWATYWSTSRFFDGAILEGVKHETD